MTDKSVVFSNFLPRKYLSPKNSLEKVANLDSLVFLVGVRCNPTPSFRGWIEKKEAKGGGKKVIVCIGEVYSSQKIKHNRQFCTNFVPF